MVIGSHNITDLESNKEALFINPIRIIKHPDYQGFLTEQYSDIALIKLSVT
jgi:hypothetical protein